VGWVRRGGWEEGGEKERRKRKEEEEEGRRRKKEREGRGKEGGRQASGGWLHVYYDKSFVGRCGGSVRCMCGP